MFTKRIAAALALIACSAQAQSVPSNIECGEIPGIEKFLIDHKIVVVGEGQRTKEMPGAFVCVVCGALRHGNTSSVGLELPFEQQEPLDKYVRADGDMSARRESLGSAFWMTDIDGRSSVAYTDMIDARCALRQNGFPLSVFPLDIETENVSRRDVMMATHVRHDYETHITALKLTYTGMFIARRRYRSGRTAKLTSG